jgi:hypothetical protein
VVVLDRREEGAHVDPIACQGESSGVILVFVTFDLESID